MKKVYVVIDAMLDIPRSQPGVIGVFETEDAATKRKQDYIAECEKDVEELGEYAYGAKVNTVIIESTLNK
jgi:hypothetical protein